ncbi:amphiphysin isoform X12 [Sander lucioperca]|uniref:amphiphysin isoform X12 n=1 Tax=Sander lucioperca TaxID=283035 RepID=UPI0016536AD9|nr:amphiphysin isoform X12 [Sander lucioperca]
MAEIKTGIFAKNVQKRLNRAQEKVLQKLGKADETKDEQFEQVVVNFRRQESEGTRLQREMKAYMAAIKGMQQASINLTQSLHEVYEPDWHGKDDVMVIGKDCDAMWEDFHNKLVDSTLLNLDEYLLQFPDLKTRVAKRSRKLIDYDSARHHMETLQVAGMKNDRKVMKVSQLKVQMLPATCSAAVHPVKLTCFCLKAEEELKKAQKVFDELNVGLQDELPTLWDSRVGFYISTFKSVTKLEAKFHREISLVCRQLYEVMTKLAEQHSDKMFTIQGAPSDSGPLRLARTPSPPDSESPPDSPDASYNHTLRPVSPGPPRPKSPIQLKKGPPVPPPPKVTPTKEVAEEQIIDLFGGEFLPAPSPSQPNERPGQSLLDMDFDAFQPDDSVSPIPQTAVPWDMWSANAQTAEPAADTGFVADWSADFGSLSANGDAAAVAEAPAVGPEGAVGGAQDWAQDGVQDGEQADGWQPAADTATPLQDREAATTSEDEDATAPSFFADFDKMNEVNPESTEAPETSETEAAEVQDKPAAPPAEEKMEESSLPSAGEKKDEPTSPAGEKIDEPTAPSAGEKIDEPTAPSAGEKIDEPTAPSAGEKIEEHAAPPAGEKIEEHTAPPAGEKIEEHAAPPAGEKIEEHTAPPAGEKIEEHAAPPAGEKIDEHTAPPAEEKIDEAAAPSVGEEDSVEISCSLKEKPDSMVGSPDSEKAELSEIPPVDEDKPSPGEAAPSEKMPIPSVVIEPASSNEGDDDRDADIISPTAISDNGVTAIKHMSPSGGVMGLPDDFLYKVETMHDFEAANSDELELNRGDVVLVVPTASIEDQEAGWLTGFKESEWLTLGTGAHKGLFPENFTQRLE